MARVVSFEYLNRQLIWHEMSELLLYLLPLLNLPRLKQILLQLLRRLSGTSASDHLEHSAGDILCELSLVLHVLR